MPCTIVIAAKSSFSTISIFTVSDGDEAREAGLDEYFGDKEGVCVVEWGQNAADILPEHFVRVSIFKTEEGRRIEIERV